MTNKAIHAFGTILKMGDGSGPPEVFAIVSELKSIPVPQMETPRIDVSTHDNAAKTREYVNNLTDFPAVNFDINYLPKDPTHNHLTGLLAKQLSGDVTNFKVFYNAAVTAESGTPAAGVPVVLTFPATVTSFRPNAPVDNVYTATVTLQPTSAPVYGSS